MNKHDYTETTDWRAQAKALFFMEHRGVSEIADICRKSRETVSRCVNACEDYDAEIEYRKAQSTQTRRDYQRQWDRDNRASLYRITGESLKREHEIAARILSAEQY